MSRSITNISCGTLAALPLLLASAGPAGAVSLGADYVFNVFGLPAMTIDVDWESTADHYTMDGSLRPALLGRIFGAINGTFEANGRVTPDGWRPDSFSMAYGGKKPWRGRATWSGDTLASLQVEPENKRKNSKSWVPLEGPAKTGFADLISGLVIRSDTAAAVCQRTLDVFDGEMRMKLALSAPHNVPLSIEGAPRRGVHCNVRFTPVAGYSTKSSSARHLEKQTIEIVWANVIDDYWVPASAVIPHRDATLRIEASRLSGER